MAYAEGSRNYVAYKEETVANTEESGSGGTILRRVTFNNQLTKAEVTSAEKRTDFQEVNVNHGTRSAPFSLVGELFGGDYAPLIGAALRRDFAAVSQITASMTISSGVITRASGSFISDGARVGDVVRLGSMTTTGNLNRNLRITAIASDGSTATVIALDGGDPVADDAGTNASATMTFPGKISFVPSTGHTSKTYTFDKYDGKNAESQVTRGAKVGSVEITVQPDTPPSITINGLGIDRRNVASGSSPVLTSPTAAGTGPAMSSGIGFVRVNGAVVAAITGLTLNLDLGVAGLPVAFANVSPDIFYGRAIQVTGSISVAKTGNSLSDLFDDETEVSLEFYIAAPGTEPRAFFSVYLPRVKFNGDDEDDPDGPVIMTLPFRALKKTSGTGHELTVIKIQDSSAA